MHHSGTIFTGVDSIIFFEKLSTDLVNQYSSVFILTDSNTREHCLPVLMSRFDIPVDSIILEIKPGEKYKTLQTCARIWKELAMSGADRHSLMICLGGGVVCDLGGFIASTYQRGIDFIYIPTTLLAQVDASIGGKTGVNLEMLKNYVGVFSSPKSIFIFTEFLHTLPKDELLSGYAEVVKHALLYSQKVYRHLVSKFPDRQSVQANTDWSEVVQHAIKVKSNIVQSDPYERSLRKVLNLGHTVGHAFESHALGKKLHLLHGFAVAMGLVVELKLSVIYCDFSVELASEVVSYILQVFPFYPFRLEEIPEIKYLMGFDKKNRDGKIQMTLIRKPGDIITNMECSDEAIDDCLREYLAFGKLYNEVKH